MLLRPTTAHVLKNDISKLKTHRQHGKKTTGFTTEEINLIVPQHELDERIREVLKTLGRESDYDDLLTKAERVTDTKAIDTIANELATTFPFDVAGEEADMTVAKIPFAKTKKRDFSGLKYRS